MFWNPFRRQVVRDAGERFRAEHSRFLTLAMLSNRRYPRIPAKRADRGGFDAMRQRQNGEKRAEQWWGALFDRVD
jgi:hypothetical protein